MENIRESLDRLGKKFGQKEGDLTAWYSRSAKVGSSSSFFAAPPFPIGR